MQPFNINVTDGPKTCNRGEDWGTYKDIVNCNTCRMPGLRITKESIWGFFEGRTPEDRLGLPLERSAEVCGHWMVPEVSRCDSCHSAPELSLDHGPEAAKVHTMCYGRPSLQPQEALEKQEQCTAHNHQASSI